MRKRFGFWLLRSLGWRTRGTFPAGCERCVLIAAPHTSNLDLFFLLAFAMAFELRVHWVGKHTLFRFPFGGIMRLLGGIPVDRRARQDTVAQLAGEFARREKLILVIAPEGTRAHSGSWKSGFYWIARQAGVPIVPSFLDYGSKTAGFGPPLAPGGSLRGDMDRLRAVYGGMRGRRSGQLGPVRLAEEDRDDFEQADGTTDTPAHATESRI
jgi:1-acyl-sn-glycerol-3-phosphate acyltransferase